MDPTARRRLGRTGVELPVLGFGGAHLGELYARVPEPQARATLEAAWEGGVRYFDTAPWYGHGLSEHRTGEFLRQQPRDGFLVSTKVGGPTRDRATSPASRARPGPAACRSSTASTTATTG